MGTHILIESLVEGGWPPGVSTQRVFPAEEPPLSQSFRSYNRTLRPRNLLSRETREPQAGAAPALDSWKRPNRQPLLGATALMSAAAAAGLVPCPFTGACFTRRA